MNIDEVVFDLNNKTFHSSVAFPSKRLTAAEQIILETEWTDFLKSLVDWGNTCVLKNLQYRLTIDEEAEEEAEEEAKH